MPGYFFKVIMNRPEESLHRAVVQYLNLALRENSTFWVHYPSGGRRTKAEAGILKAMGTKAGIPDLIFIRRRDDYWHYIMAVELKSPSGRLSQNQKSMIDRLSWLSIPTIVCHTVESVESALRAHQFTLHATVSGKP